MTSAALVIENAADQLPSPDGVALAIMQMWRDEDATVRELSRLVQTDPALTGRLLRLANSAALGYRPVASVPEAIVRVGMKAVGQLATAFSLIDNYSEGRCEGFDYQRFWTHSLLMALLSRGLAVPTRIASPDDIFACALMSRIGMLAMATLYPEEYSKLLEADGSTLADAERERFGFDHNEMSEQLLMHFGVPEALAEPARFHEAPRRSSFPPGSRPRKIADVMHLAYKLSDSAIDSERKSFDKSEIGPVISRLELVERDVERIYGLAVEEWKEWSKLLDLPSKDVIQFSAAAREENQETKSKIEGYRAVVADDSADREKLRGLLTERGIRVALCESQETALQAAVTGRPKLLVIGQPQGSRSVAEFCEMIRSTEWGTAVFVIVITETMDEQTKVEAYRSGADSVLASDVSRDEFSARLVAAERFIELQSNWLADRTELKRIANELVISHRKLETLSMTDQLTGLPNRRAAMAELERAWHASERDGTPMTAVMVDVDHFKKINDTFGHTGGDTALETIATTLREGIRAGESIFRLGGEEFLLISARSGLKEMVVAAERLRRMVAAIDLQVGDKTTSVSISLGIAERHEDHASFDDVLKNADEALFEAKTNGRNRICYSVQGQIRSVACP